MAGVFFFAHKAEAATRFPCYEYVGNSNICAVRTDNTSIHYASSTEYAGQYPDTSTRLGGGTAAPGTFDSYSKNGTPNTWTVAEISSGMPTTGEWYYQYDSGGNSTAISQNAGTHIIEITAPQLYSTTTSPVNVSFSYYVASSSLPNGYLLTYVNTLSYKTTQYIGGVTEGYTTDGVYHLSTTTPLTGNGTWKLTISLIDYSPDVPNAGYQIIDTAPDVWFGLNYNDNVTTVTFDGCADSEFASTTCAINFTGSFNASQCIDYLFRPSCSSLSVYSAIPNQLNGKFPFSYIAGIKNTWSSLVASTTANSPSYSFNLHDLNIGSTTSLGNVLPNQVVFSASTTKQYFPAGTFDILKTLAGLAIILGLFADIFFGVKNLIKT